MSPQQQVYFPEEYLAREAICATGTICQGLADFEVPEETPNEDLEEWARQETWYLRYRSDSPVTLDLHSTELQYFISESPFDVLDQMLGDEEKITKLIRTERAIAFSATSYR